MNNKRSLSRLFNLVLAALVLGACGTPQTTVAQDSPTATTTPTSTTMPTDIPAPTFTSTPAEQVKQSPAPRGELQLAYDSKTDQILLFGGATGNPNLMSSMSDETWVYDIATNTWTEIKSPSAPRPRDNASLVYDAESDRFVLFGGANPETFCMQVTWSFDMNTKTWTRMKAEGPRLCLGASMVYNSKADRMLVFGGFNFDIDVARNDLWSYDYNTDTWTELTPAVSPPGHQFSSMVYDTKADRVIMWGGWGTENKDNEVGVWIYDYNTNTWEKRVTDNGPTSRAFHNLSYDPQADRTLLYGGYTGGIPDVSCCEYTTYNSDETWAYDYKLNTWTLLEPAANPGPLSFVGQVYVPSIGRILLYGGKIELAVHSDKIWLFNYDTNIWTEMKPNP